ncbi:putative major structural protein [Dysaphis plantaginea densovirus]|uniref:Major structural protein n=1 Tax=Dysaphis plantaginea densovirus 1 TaxID=3070906 RepID=B5TYI9_9VIRU|nr:putative major structural protein [Dysaphis plantaginea densovirus]ACI01075.1 putative major structural protein [Dysaphis plantaginea densovirus]
MPHRYQGPPPPQRPNWSKLNSSQRAYAIRQYNIGRTRRNLPIFVLGGGGDRIDSSASEQSSEHSSGSSVQASQNSDPADDTDSLRTPSVDWSEDSVFGDNADSDFDHIISADDVVAGTSAAGGITDKELWPHIPDSDLHMATNVSSTKRGSEEPSSSSGDSKKQKKNGMELPGTGESGGSDPDTGNPSPENSIIPRPLQSTSGYKLVFRKNHSLLSYGLAWKISKLDGTSKSYLTTTSLMSLPVEQPYFYMSPAEFDWLPRGAMCKHVKVTAVMRNPRTAFETNSSSTTLATLNQNKFIAIGEGLNLKTRGIDRAMKFGSSTAAMVNQGTEEYVKSHHEKFILAAYGSLTKTPTFQEGFKALPCSSLMLPMMLNRYFCTVATNDPINKDIGWPNLSQHIRKGDASFLTGKTVATYSYSPKCGYLSQPFQMRVNGYYGDESNDFTNNSVTAINKNGNLLSSIVQTDLASGAMKQSDNNIIDYESGEWDCLAQRNGTHYMTPIEKSQYIMHGPRDTSLCHVQPSLHLGVFPVPRMTTNELKTVPENYTDIEVQWDINCEMVVEFGYGTMNLTHYDKPYLVNIENAAYGASISSDKNTYFQNQYSSINGEYVCRVKKSTT